MPYPSDSAPQPLLPAGRSLKDFGRLFPAEQKLLDACRAGKTAVIADTRPSEATDDNTVRAAFIRFLALGGDYEAPVHEKGVLLHAAWIHGELDLTAASVPHELFLNACHFDTCPVLRGAHLQGSLSLQGCELPGLAADRLVCDGGVFLSNTFHATNEVRLLGAQIAGDLVCIGGKFNGQDGDALSCDNANISGSIFLKDEFSASGTVRLLSVRIGKDLECTGGKFDGNDGYALICDSAIISGGIFLRDEFNAIGTVRLPGVQIGQNLDCSGGKFNGKNSEALFCDGAKVRGAVFLSDNFSAIGTVSLLGAHIGQNLECTKGRFEGKSNFALLCDGMTVLGSFFFCDILYAVNRISLSHAQVGQLIDDERVWGEELILDGFKYGSFAGDAPTSAEQRLKWLNKQNDDAIGRNGSKGFRPQPWQQLQKVLRETGHVEESRKVAVAFEGKRRKLGQVSSPALHWLDGFFLGYGYYPMRLFYWMVGIWLACAAIYWGAALSSVFGPSNPLVILNSDLAICRPPSETPKQQNLGDFKKPKEEASKPTGAGNWYLCEKLPEEYTGFSPLAYSLDLILPLVDLQQDKDWAPLIPTPGTSLFSSPINFLKYFTRWVLWFEILFGWVASLLLVAVVSGLTKRRED